jgi:hypothetical protein
MEKADLVIGGIYNVLLPNLQRVRIIGIGEHHVLYDPFLDHLGKWAIADFPKRGAAYCRTYLGIFLRNAEFVGALPLTKEQHAFLRPDLPYNPIGINSVDWSAILLKDSQELKAILDECDINPSSILITTKSLAIHPFGSKGRITSDKPMIFETSDEGGFSAIELLASMVTVQRHSYVSDIRKGIGLYRSGHYKGVPSYFNEEYPIIE